VQNVDEVTAGGGLVQVIFAQALDSQWVAIVLLISTAGQFFCTTACQTSASRMLFAFSRDRAVPGHQLWSKLSSSKIPANGVMITAALAALITLPAIVPVDINGAPAPIAFYAVVSIGVVGLYLCFAVPIYYRWKAGDSFPVGKWNLRGHHKWMAPVALVEIVVTSIIAMFPTSMGGMPWDPSFEWKFVNYTPLLVGGVLILLFINWHVSVKNWFTGPIKQVTTVAEDLLTREPNLTAIFFLSVLILFLGRWVITVSGGVVSASSKSWSRLTSSLPEVRASIVQSLKT